MLRPRDTVTRECRSLNGLWRFALDAATHGAVAWVDGTKVVEHQGGYTPFEAEVTEVVTPGAEHRITVVVNNVLSWQTIPPGYVTATPDGPRQRLLFDFFNYAGLNRSVWLCTTPASYVDDVTVVTGLDGSTGRLRYQVGTAAAETGRSGSRSATPRAPRSRGPPAARASSPSRTCTGGALATATSTS